MSAIPNEISLKELVEQFRFRFKSNQVDVEDLKRLMKSYNDSTDWIKFVNFFQNRYTRVLIDGGNGKYNLILLCWPPGSASSIHDHPGSHCIMKVLHGSLNEIRYEWPDRQMPGTEMKEIADTRLDPYSVAYINDSIGLHRVMNNDPLIPAVSLHLYCPPFKQCQSFDKASGLGTIIDLKFDAGVEMTPSYKVSQHESITDILVFETQQTLRV